MSSSKASRVVRLVVGGLGLALFGACSSQAGSTGNADGGASASSTGTSGALTSGSSGVFGSGASRTTGGTSAGTGPGSGTATTTGSTGGESTSTGGGLSTGTSGTSATSSGSDAGPACGAPITAGAVVLTSGYAAASVIGDGGYVYAYDDGTSTICVDGAALCAQGETGAASSTVWGAGVNINLNQSMATGSPANPFTVTGTGISYSVSALPPQGLRINIGNLSGSSGTDYCTVLTAASGTIPWSKFNTQCWNNSGTYLTGAPSGPLHVAFQVPAIAAATPFSFCVDSVSFATSGGSGDAGMPSAALHVAGNVLQANGKTVRLFGVDRSGTEYQCIHGQGIFDGPVDQTAVSAILGWHVNAVRVPLNEDCWLNINGAPGQYSGSAYTSAITQWVTLLRQNGLYVIVDLHWNAGGTNEATGQQEMADSDHAPAFWTSVADTFKGDQGIIFDLYNEPHDVSWACWLNGGCQTNGWNVAGMNQLITAVRATGATNVIMAGGLSYAGDLSGWLANKPTDPLNNLAASAHVYNFTTCSASSCWTSNYQPVAAAVPLITGELGENDCAAGFVNSYMAWADGVGVSYVGWAWNADFSCSGGPALISDWTGTPTGMGSGFQSHFASVNP